MSSGVEFEEDSFGSSGSSQPHFASSRPASSGFQSTQSGYSNSTEGGGLGGWLVRHHLAKSQNSAQIIMIGIVIINIIITIVALKFFL